MFGSVRDPEFWGGVIVVCVAALLSGVVGGYVGGWVPYNWFVAGVCP